MPRNSVPYLLMYLDDSGCWWNVSNKAELEPSELNYIPRSEFEDGARFPSARQLKTHFSAKDVHPLRSAVILDHRDTGYSTVAVPEKRHREHYHAAKLAAQSILTPAGEPHAPVFDYITGRLNSNTELSVYTADSGTIDALLLTLSSLSISCEYITTYMHVLGSGCGCQSASSPSVRVYVCGGEMVALTCYGAALKDIHRQPLSDRPDIRTRQLEGSLLQSLLSLDKGASPASICVSVLDGSINKNEELGITASLHERAGIKATWHSCPEQSASLETSLGKLPAYALRMAKSQKLSRRIKPDFAHPKKLNNTPRNVARSIAVAAVLATAIHFYQQPSEPLHADEQSLENLSQRQLELQSDCESLKAYESLAELIQDDNTFTPDLTEIITKLADVREKENHKVTLTRCEALRGNIHASHIRISVLSPSIESILSYQKALTVDAAFEVYMHNWHSSNQASSNALVGAEIDIYIRDAPASSTPPALAPVTVQSQGVNL